MANVDNIRKVKDEQKNLARRLLTIEKFMKRADERFEAYFLKETGEKLIDRRCKTGHVNLGQALSTAGKTTKQGDRNQHHTTGTRTSPEARTAVSNDRTGEAPLIWDQATRKWLPKRESLASRPQSSCQMVKVKRTSQSFFESEQQADAQPKKPVVVDYSRTDHDLPSMSQIPESIVA